MMLSLSREIVEMVLFGLVTDERLSALLFALVLRIAVFVMLRLSFIYWGIMFDCMLSPS